MMRRIGYNVAFLLGVWGWLMLAPYLDKPAGLLCGLFSVVLALSGLNWIIRDEIRNSRNAGRR